LKVIETVGLSELDATYCPLRGEELDGFSLPEYVKIVVRFHMLEDIVDDGIATTLAKDDVLVCLEFQQHVFLVMMIQVMP
jgi:hypothetical protein